MPRCTPTSLLLILAATLAAEDQRNPVIAFGSDTVTDLGAYFLAPLDWSGRDWAVATGIGVTIGAVAITADQHVKDTAQNHRSDGRDRLGDVFNPLGTAFSLGYLGVAWGVGEAVGDPRGAWLARDGLEATLIATGITTATKMTVGRSRPSDVEEDRWEWFSNNRSFPSGHTTQAFALASVTARTFDDQPWVGAMAFTVATGVGLARINGNHHYASDTLMGAAIGTSVGWFVVGQNRGRRAEATAIKPVVATDRCGVVWTF